MVLLMLVGATSTGRGAGAWRTAGGIGAVNNGPTQLGLVADLACPSARVCVASGESSRGRGAFWTTTDAQDPKPGWKVSETVR